MALILGLDTGGTFTDAALLDADGHKVVAHTKSLTTRYNLSIGVGEAMATVLEEWGGNKADISLVSLSTTLATNAVVESVGGLAVLFLSGLMTTFWTGQACVKPLAMNPIFLSLAGINRMAARKPVWILPP